MRRPREIQNIFGNDGTIRFEKEEYTYLDPDCLETHPDHKFKLHTGVRMEKLIESIECAGVMQAILVSERDEKRYLLAGYNRVYASRKANKKMVPAIIKRDLSRIQEVQIINFTNFFSRGTSDYSYLERVRAMKAEYNQLVNSRKRSDESYEKQSTREYFASLYEMTDSTMNRFLTLDKLCDELLEFLDDKKINISVALKLAELDDKKQQRIYRFLLESKRKISIKESQLLIEQLHNDEELRLDVLKDKNKKAKLSYEIDKTIMDNIPSGKQRQEAIEQSLMFSQKSLPDWFENHDIVIAGKNIYDYVLSILEKVYLEYPELMKDK
ncbi:ParB/RepB/Spo0J family partition protein [Massilicoli timonensis]|uniref:ParB/RepB/Spo0J family partition protein n=1 Tax=Massilicoli timonensis TaxID=2015901 RepID=UPI000C8227FA|nr:ParB/RepB/Spo0J family partition protein [Massilicoli timonensis]